ncbi:hypothetical protein Misp01_16450 [Microtetraspora sp. NBRC 13810]|uniref:alpha/beta fold hydrolase n=1 Tax=Microtetraspora sp. NBRC 13810 TaxID=3030990 RepID=UPI0024A2C8DD|nr:alpha/beta hydrolase [Microtetraspora sp. NBRC 13810]GLW06515.1 hypothetical protein Misp01_16450 [Microtetraspora sp. NBRC 13810]
MSTYVLVPGFWLGSWAWDEVAEPLRAAGHEVHTVTLTGLAERAHLGGAGTDLETHIADLVGLIHDEDLRDVILVGHSGAMGAVTGAADRFPERIARVVFVDSGPQPDGASWMDFNPPEWRAHLLRRIEEQGEGVWHPFLPWAEQAESGVSLEGLGEAVLARVQARATAQPAGMLTQPLKRTGGFDRLPKTLLACSFPLDQVRAMIDSGHPFFAEMAGPEWTFLALPTGHWPMFSRPQETAELLASL